MIRKYAEVATMTTTTEQAIRMAVLRFSRAGFGRGVHGLQAVRVTGEPGLGGIWQCYAPVRGGGLSSYGPNLHATSDGVIRAR